MSVSCVRVCVHVYIYILGESERESLSASMNHGQVSREFQSQNFWSRIAFVQNLHSWSLVIIVYCNLVKTLDPYYIYIATNAINSLLR